MFPQYSAARWARRWQPDGGFRAQYVPRRRRRLSDADARFLSVRERRARQPLRNRGRGRALTCERSTSTPRSGLESSRQPRSSPRPPLPTPGPLPTHRGVFVSDRYPVPENPGPAPSEPPADPSRPDATRDQSAAAHTDGFGCGVHILPLVDGIPWAWPTKASTASDGCVHGLGLARRRLRPRVPLRRRSRLDNAIELLRSSPTLRTRSSASVSSGYGTAWATSSRKPTRRRSGSPACSQRAASICTR